MPNRCTWTRRQALATAGTALAGTIAGCQLADDGTDEATSTAPGGTEPPPETTTVGRPATPATTDSSPDGQTPPHETPATPGTPVATPALADLTVAAEQIAAGFTSPVGVVTPQPNRHFIVDQPGQIYLLDDAGLHEAPFLDLSDRMVEVSGYSEQGLLGLAFHPDFATNGRLFVRYSAPPRQNTPRGYSHTFVLAEFQTDPGARRADPASETTILEIPQPQRNHNAGDIVFGPDGYLYVATGDGGGANDQGNGHVTDWYDANGGGNGQDITQNLLGSILRIDVDGSTGSLNYAIPDDNPLVGADGRPEQWAWGFRNPWRFSFGPTGRLFAADVGQNAWEEVNIVAKGGNYGWNVREGTHCFGAESCPTESPRGRPLRDPVIEYPHSGAPVSGIAVIGGYLYDGTDVPALQNLYVFADWRAQGRLFAARESSDGLWPTATVSVTSGAQFGPNVLSFGRTPDGELLVTTTAEGAVTGSTGALFRLQAPG